MASEQSSQKGDMSQQLPIQMASAIIPGFGRGSKELGIPTANISRDDLSCKIDYDSLPCGIYWGFARVVLPPPPPSNDSKTSNNGQDDSDKNTTSSVTSSSRVYKAAISIGFNPYYNNEAKTVEPHLIAPPEDPRRRASSCGETQLEDLYGATIRLSIIGYLRPELPFEGLEKLKLAIKNDILETEKLCDEKNELTLNEFEWVKSNASI